MNPAISAAVFVIFFVSAVVSAVLRFRVFRELQDGPLRDILRGTHVLTFGDLLAARLFLAKGKEEVAKRRLIEMYFYTSLSWFVCICILFISFLQSRP